MADSNGEFQTILGPDAVFKGELKFDKGLRILGKFDGTIQSKGTIHIADSAKLKANIDAGAIEVDGDVVGNLNAVSRIQLRSTAKLEGDLKTSRLEVADGATFVGNCIVGPQENGKAPSATPAKTDPAADQAAKTAKK